MRNYLLFGVVLASLTQLPGCADGAARTSGSTEEYDVPLRAEDVQPLAVGQLAPAAILRTPEGEPLDLRDAYTHAPTLLIFYRGGWCPYCSAHLGEIALSEDELNALGVQVLAVSPDRPEKLQESAEDRELGYQLLSDSDMSLARAFGLAFKLDQEQVEQYALAGFDLVEASGYDHHLLPVPTVYLIDTEGTIRFAHWDPDYRRRIETGELLAAVRASVRD